MEQVDTPAEVPKYSAIASKLIGQIRNGEYRVGDLPPSEPELSRFHVAELRQSICLAFANPQEADDLGPDPGTPVMCVERRFFDERGGLLEGSRTVHPPESFRYEMSLRRVIGR